MYVRAGGMYVGMMYEVFTVCVLAVAGSAGDRLGHGEEGDGAQARHHPAAGERHSTFLSFQPLKLPAWLTSDIYKASLFLLQYISSSVIILMSVAG